MKRYVNVAINKDYMDVQKYAFRKYKIKTIENSHTHLAPEELKRLEKLQLTGNDMKLQTTLDAFLFCCYAGLRYSDFVSLKPENFIVLNKEIWLMYKSIKTKTEVRLPLYLLFDSKGISILEKYMDNLSAFFKLRDNSNINKELIKISKLSGISKHISFHLARHSYFSFLLKTNKLREYSY